MPQTPAPAPYGAVPSARQLTWHAHPFYGFIHFTLNTWTGREWGYGDESPSLFDPSDLDCRQWARVAREAGMSGLILTAKHHDGFCLWPSAYTEHSVKASPWKHGKGDVVREFVDACAAEGIRAGLYLSPWDRNHAEYGRDAYVDYYHAQLRELLTQYGPLFSCWFDGANGGDGYYGGARETRQIDRTTYYRWDRIVATVRELQPDAVIFSDAGPDTRWVGNERGFAAETCWATLNADSLYPGCGITDPLFHGERAGASWIPPEIDVSIRPGWFWHAEEDRAVKTVDHLLDIYYRAVGHGGGLNLNLPPDRRGRIHEHDVAALREMRRILDATTAVDYAAGRPTAAHVRGNDSTYGGHHAVDGRPDTYWATDDDSRRPLLAVQLDGVQAINTVAISEYIPLGQRIDSARVEWYDGMVWRVFGEVGSIGARRILRGPTVYTDQVRLQITGAAACPCIQAFQVWRRPDPGVAAPGLAIGPDGRVQIIAPPGADSVHVTVDGPEPTPADPSPAAPLDLPQGGLVKAKAWRHGEPGPCAQRLISISSRGWRVAGASSAAVGHDPAGILRHDDAGWLSLDGAPLPQHVDIDFGQALHFQALVYTPLASGQGLLTAYAILSSADGQTWTPAAPPGRLGNMQNDPRPRRIALPRPVHARYLRLVGTASLDGRIGVGAIALFP